MTPFEFFPFPNIDTKRLSLRQLKAEDENEIFIFRSDKRILEYLDIPVAESIDDAVKYISDKLISSYTTNGFGLLLEF